LKVFGRSDLPKTMLESRCFSMKPFWKPIANRKKGFGKPLKIVFKSPNLLADFQNLFIVKK
jgi:hypothetical protein